MPGDCGCRLHGTRRAGRVYAYKISCIHEIYDILRDSYDFSCAEIATILDFKGNILEQIYDEWLHDEYSYHHNLLEDTITKALNLIKGERNK